MHQRFNQDDQNEINTQAGNSVLSGKRKRFSASNQTKNQFPLSQMG